MKVTEDEVMLVCDVFSSAFGTPNLKPPVEELLSVLDVPAPNVPPLVPN